MLARASRRGAARPAGRPARLRRRAQDDGHPAAVPVGEPARPHALRRRRPRGRTSTPSRRRCGATANGLPMHGLLAGSADGRSSARPATARCSPRRSTSAQAGGLTAAFPFPHTLTLEADAARPATLTIATTVDADAGGRPVPIAFGYPPVPAPPGRRSRGRGRSRCRCARRCRSTTGCSRPASAIPVTVEPGPLGARTFDDAYVAPADAAPFVLAGGGRRIELAFLDGLPVRAGVRAGGGRRRRLRADDRADQRARRRRRGAAGAGRRARATARRSRSRSSDLRGRSRRQRAPWRPGARGIARPS